MLYPARDDSPSPTYHPESSARRLHPAPGGVAAVTVRMADHRIWALVLIISIGWGSSPVAVRIALREGLGPITIASASSLIAAGAVMILMASLRRGKLVGRLEWRIGAVLSVLSVLLPFQTRNMALENASAGFVTLISTLIPLVTVVVAHFMLADERMELVIVVGLLLGLGGVAVLLLGGDSGIAEGGNPPLAGMFGLISVVSVSFGAVYAKRYAGRYSVLGVTIVQLVIGAAALSLLALLVEGVPADPSMAGRLSLLYVGLVGTFVPLGLYYFLIRHVTVTYSTIIGYVVPFIGVFAGVLVLDEQLQPGIVIGGALVLLGVVITDLVRVRDSRREI